MHRRFSAVAMMAVFVLLGVVTAVSCGGRYGDIRLDSTVERVAESLVMDPTMDYYYSGPDLYPNALIAVKRGYKLGPDLWKAMGRDAARFRDTVLHMQERAREFGESPRGFVMTDDRGNTVGWWYSVMRAKTMLRMEGEDHIIVYPPELVIFDKTSVDGSVTEDKR